ncbi:MAG: hypothetical protein WBE28_10340 [bacterium]
MANIWDDVVKWLDDASRVVGKEAGDLTQKGTLKLEIIDLSRKLRDRFTELGSEVYQSAFVQKKTTWQTSKKVKSAVSKIRIIERKLKKKNLEYKKVGNEQKRKKK